MRIVPYRGKWCASVKLDGKRRRLSLGNLDATGPEEQCPNYPAAQRKAAELEAELKAPADGTCAAIMKAYLADLDGRAVAPDRAHNAWKALRHVFAPLTTAQITREVCEQYIDRRKAAGRKDGTIRKEMTVLRAAVNWAEKHNEAVWKMPPPPPSKDRYLTEDEFDRLLKAASKTFHLLVFLHLGIATAGRKEALLDLRWERGVGHTGWVDFERNEVVLGVKPNGKKRATVPMGDTLRAVLLQAKAVALTKHVIEFEGQPIKSIRTAFASACRRAKLKGVTPHVLRHTSGVWMAAGGIPLDKICDYMGHSDYNVTKRIYAKFRPEHLRDAAAVLDVGRRKKPV